MQNRAVTKATVTNFTLSRAQSSIPCYSQIYCYAGSIVTNGLLAFTRFWEIGRCKNVQSARDT